ncbi:MAG: alanine racemase [Alphaproteobacteria bacterium]|nr:alanine racemase [Alphaproteobacteria bacterium]
MVDAAARPSQAVLDIDLGAIVANWRSLKTRLAPGAECAGVVKADAYGLGADRVAPALAAAGCRRFFVAHLGEALEIRPLLPAGAEVYVLGGVLPGEEPEFRAGGVLPVLNDPGQVERWAGYGRRLGVALGGALHVDTGMSRLGLMPAEARSLAASPGALEGTRLGFVMSHLARSEEAVAMNAEQLAAFESLRALWPKLGASFANSSGIFLGPAYHLNLARPGAALYGINPLPGTPNPQRPVATLSAPVLQLRDIAPPQTVGYGASYAATAPTRVATIAIGYADGWLRSLSGRGQAWFQGRTLPFIGRVSMDLVTLDATAVPDLKAGDRVELMGVHRPVDDVADEAGTNGYEILTRLGSRFARRHHGA